ncbi:MAG: zf-HC2 domain-containing protein, partial [Chloroflexota bacterium]|nr:zf-HC2 domain-containing protein [Chloroflexota bacterium]
MLSHAEAQALVSARLDGPLDPIAARELQAHLATCASCRAFNTSSTQLMRGLRSMPYLPASPAVKRAVIDHIRTPRTPWNVVSGPWLTRAVPVVTIVAAALVLTVLGTVAVQRLNDTQSPLDAVTSFLSQTASETEPPDSNVTFQSTEEATTGQPTTEAGPTEVPGPEGPTESDSVVPPTPSQSSDSGTEGQSGQRSTL